MLKLTVFVAVVTLCVCAVPHEKIAKIFADMDFDNNDSINKSEILIFFIGLTDYTGDPLGKSVFVRSWSKRYGDSEAVSGELFEKMDFNNDALLTESDADLFLKEVANGNDKIEWDEFETVFSKWYAEIL